MSDNKLMNKIYLIFKNPIKAFGFITMFLMIVLFFICQFQMPDFYSNQELANQIAQTVSPKEVYQATKYLLNPKHSICNLIFQIWGLSITIFFFTICFGVNEFKKFKELTVLNKKNFVFLWINLSYPLWSFAYVFSSMIDLEKYVYNGAADSLGIPFFILIYIAIFFGIVYYLFMNLLAIITFNTKIKRKIYTILWIFVFFVYFIFALSSFLGEFSYFRLFLDLYYFIWLMFTIYAINFIKNK